MNHPTAQANIPQQLKNTFESCHLQAEFTNKISTIKQSAEYSCFLVPTEQKNYLVKLSKDSNRNHKLFNCFVATNLALRQKVQTPKLIRFFSPLNKDNQSVMILEYIPGESCDQTFNTFSKTQTLQFLADLGKAIAKLHRYSPLRYSERLNENSSQTLNEVVLGRLDYCFSQPSAFADIERKKIDASKQLIKQLLSHVEKVSAPTLIHGDMGLRNLIEHEKKLASIIDFEHAKFHDPAYDFVKLSFNFADQPEQFEHILEHYFAATGKPKLFEQRLGLFTGLEILSGVPYFHRTDDMPMYQVYLDKLNTWLTQHG